MGTAQSKFQGRYKRLSNAKDGSPLTHPTKRSPTPECIPPDSQSVSSIHNRGSGDNIHVASPQLAPIASMEEDFLDDDDDDDDHAQKSVTITTSPTLFSMPPSDDVIKQMNSVNQNDRTDDSELDSEDFDDASIAVSDFDEDMISLSWADSFHSRLDIEDRINTPTETTNKGDEVEKAVEKEIEAEKTAAVTSDKQKKKRPSLVKSVRKFLRRRKEKKERKKPKGWVWWTPEGTLCVVDENGNFFQEHHVVHQMRFRQRAGGPETLRYWVSQDCACPE
ncbi:uncharacterized protein [Diadema setosum]|uniref:uncharacterized protein n=1 Tax=Diadema setosum TaxID=31175 RepID=UPI003B3AB808